MATTWAPSTHDVAALASGWSHVITPETVVPLIDMAVAEVVSEIGAFNADAQIVDGVTLGDVAHDVAALRAAYQWASGMGPEMDLEYVRSLHARFADALARLRRLTAGGTSYSIVTGIEP